MNGPENPDPRSPTGKTDLLEDLKRLHASHLLTDEEYERCRLRALDDFLGDADA